MSCDICIHKLCVCALSVQKMKDCTAERSVSRWSVGRLVGWLVGCWWVGWLVGGLVGWWVRWLVGRLVGWWVGWSVSLCQSDGAKYTSRKKAVQCKASGSAVIINNHTDRATVSLYRRRGCTHPI
jgi:hypothetical protein